MPLSAKDYLLQRQNQPMVDSSPKPGKPPERISDQEMQAMAKEQAQTGPAMDSPFAMNQMIDHAEGRVNKTGFWGALESAGEAIGHTGIGIAKSFIKLPQQAAALGNDIGMRAAAAIRPDATYEQIKAARAGSGMAKAVERPEWTKAHGTAEGVGETIGDIGQFFIPVGGVAKAAGMFGKAAEAAKAANLIEKGAIVAEKVGQTAEAGTKALNFGEKALGLGKKVATEAFEQGARTALQKGEAGQDAVTAAAVGALMPVLGAGLGLAKGQFPAWSRKLEEVNLRLTPQQRRMFTDKIDDVTEYMSKNKIFGSAEKRLAKVTERYDSMEPQLQHFLSTEAKDRVVPKQQLLDELESLKTGFQDRVDTDVVEGQIDRVINTIKSKQGENVPALNLNKLKRSAYDSAYNEGGNKVLDDVMHDVGDVLRRNVETATEGMHIAGKPLGEFNQEYGTLINARKLLRTAASRKDVGFLSKLVATLAGSTLGSVLGPVGSVVGASAAPSVAEVVAGTGPRSLISAGLRSASEKTLPPVIKPLIEGTASQIIQKTGD